MPMAMGLLMGVTEWFLFLINFIYLLATLHSLWDFSSPTRDRTWAPSSGISES